jgi:hypothetical protein
MMRFTTPSLSITVHVSACDEKKESLAEEKSDEKPPRKERLLTRAMQSFRLAKKDPNVSCSTLPTADRRFGLQHRTSSAREIKPTTDRRFGLLQHRSSSAREIKPVTDRRLGFLNRSSSTKEIKSNRRLGFLNRSSSTKEIKSVPSSSGLQIHRASSLRSLELMDDAMKEYEKIIDGTTTRKLTSVKSRGGFGFGDVSLQSELDGKYDSVLKAPGLPNHHSSSLRGVGDVSLESNGKYASVLRAPTSERRVSPEHAGSTPPRPPSARVRSRRISLNNSSTESQTSNPLSSEPGTPRRGRGLGGQRSASLRGMGDAMKDDRNQASSRPWFSGMSIPVPPKSGLQKDQATSRSMGSIIDILDSYDAIVGDDDDGQEASRYGPTDDNTLGDREPEDPPRNSASNESLQSMDVTAPKVPEEHFFI